MINDVFILQSFSFFSLSFFINTINILTLWYLAGFFLMNFGLLLLNDDADIFIGFLWVIDLGVGLIFFIFILHFSNFLHQKTITHLMNKFFFFSSFFVIFLIIFFFFFADANNSNVNWQLAYSWFFFISSYDYYKIFSSFNVTELNLLREIYFYQNSFHFLVINFMLFYGIFLTIVLTFLLKRYFLFLNFSQIVNLNLLTEVNSYFFIRNQNFLKQQNTSAGVRVWEKKKYLTPNDF